MARQPSSSAASSAAESARPADLPLPASYDEAMAELEQLVARMEAGALPLEQLLVAYQRGASLLGFCRERLQAVEDQVRLLDEGQLKPWDAA
jgi:exodeoxyribonuclease VII small subunit